MITTRLGPVTALFLLAAPLMAAAAAQDAEKRAPLPPPEGPVILTVSGEISRTNRDGTAEFDLAMLEEIGGHRLSTSTPWTIGVQEFEGVLLEDLLRTLGATGNLIFAKALNDYQSEIPSSDATREGALIAYRRNGAEMTLREKGPLWVVYPYDENMNYTLDIYMTRSIWQLNALILRTTETEAGH